MPKKKKTNKSTGDNGPVVEGLPEATASAASDVKQDTPVTPTVVDADTIVGSDMSAMFNAMNVNKESAAKDKEQLIKLLAQRQRMGGASSEGKEHQFWNTQPVPQDDEDIKADQESVPIEVKTVDQVRQEPYSLPAAFEWSVCDMNNKDIVDEVYTLLWENYVEDDDNTFRFDYSRDFLKWALQPPGFLQNLHIGVRVKTGKKKLVGFITGVPADVKVYDKKTTMVEINFLCVHKKLRSKRLAPVLIKEVTRRVNLQNVWQAVYTAGVVLPKPVAQNRYYHRSLNPKKLIDIGFSRLQPRMTLARTIKLYKVATETQIPGIRQMEQKDVPQVCALLTKFLDKFKLHQVFSEAEVGHILLPRAGVVYSYVVEDPETHKITDLLSFYSLPSTIIGNDKYQTLRAAYSFYNVAGKYAWDVLMTDALILAKQLDFDVFNALNVMENDSFLTKLKFGIGDGNLQYYLFNWKCPIMSPDQVGLVLL